MPKFLALEEPSREAIRAADMSVWASMCLASSVSRRAMKAFALIPEAAWAARVRVRVE